MKKSFHVSGEKISKHKNRNEHAIYKTYEVIKPASKGAYQLIIKSNR